MSPTSHNACLACRTGKVKCRSSSIDQPCERCQRNSLGCVFEKHRRGRKPGTRIKPRVSNAQSTITHESRAPLITTPGTSGSHEDSRSEDRAHSTSDGWGTIGLQPASILSREAQSGRFSLGSILCVPDAEPKQTAAPLPADSRSSSSGDDPILCRLLSFEVAFGLFESFMRNLNPYICQLDPKLHSFGYVRKKSILLLTTILSASAKSFYPSLHPALREHSQKLLGQAFMHGSKSIETVQGILISTSWKEPDESRTWLLVGYAIRICIERGWHELESCDTSVTSNDDEIIAREKRNIQRTWLVLFVYDRSLSLQLGKPWMMEQKGIIMKADSWCRDHLAVPGADLVLSSFVSLRIISSELLELAAASQAFEGHRGELLSKMLNNRLTSWDQNWLPLFDQEEIAPCHRFLANFYGLHQRLLLNSYFLQASLLSLKDDQEVSKASLLLCSSSAIGMLEQISMKFGPYKQLYFAQDSVHMMVAYATVFLIKLLVSLPDTMRMDLEVNCVQAILKASHTFEEQCATQTTGCAMQARFMRSVIDRYQTLKSQNRPTIINKEAAPTSPRQPASELARNSSVYDPDNGRTVPSNPQHEENDMAGGLSAGEQNHNLLGTNLFADKDLWDSLFSDVEFWMNDGTVSTNNPNII